MSSRTQDVTGDPQTVDEARDAVERSRERISSTLDQLEGRIVEKKHELQEKADIFRPVREQVVARPFTAIAIAVGVGALLGSLGGGSDDDDDAVWRTRSDRPRARLRRPATGDGFLDDDDRSELRQWRRSRRERLRSRTRHAAGHDAGHDSRLSGVRQQLMGAVTSAITAAITARIRDFATSATGGGNGRSTRSR
jgi:ElaB/YqjD/DUF883 family membrane-anchored ribosome-binding protein